MWTFEDLVRVTGVQFSKEQRDAITRPLEPTLVIAGAGTGKTTVMAARVVWLVGSGAVQPEEVLGLTFTRKAAAELGERIRRALELAGFSNESTDKGREQVSTYDAFAARIGQEHALRIGVDNPPLLITGAERFQLMDQVVRGRTAPLPSLNSFAISTIIGRALQLAGELASNLVSVEAARSFTMEAKERFAAAPGWGKGGRKPYKALVEAAAHCDQRLELLELVADYQEHKARLNVAEYADQLRAAAELATSIPTIGQGLRERYLVVLLDEYQDTSAAQTKLLTALFDGHPVTAVGDPYQAIYGWRGAAASNILQFKEDFGATKNWGLSINRRSEASILEIGNAIAARIPGELGVKLEPPEGTGPGRVEALRARTQAEEIDWVADQIAELEGVSAWKEVAVLCRRNSDLAVIHQALTARDVPTEIVGLGGLLSLPEIVPVVAFLRLLADPLDNPAVATLLTGPALQLPLVDLLAVSEKAKGLCTSKGEPICLLEGALLEPNGLSERGKATITRFKQWIQSLRPYSCEPVGELAHRIIQVLGIEEELRARGRTTAQLALFVDICTQHTFVGCEPTLASFVAYLEAEERDGIGLERAQISQEDSVKLLTIHRAKGLEWDRVFLPGLVDQVFPAQHKGGNWVTGAELLPAPLRGDADWIPQLEEYTNDALTTFQGALKDGHRQAEDRLGYVAVTRARKQLMASCHRWSSTAKGERKQSPYFAAVEAVAKQFGTALDRFGNEQENPLVALDQPIAWPVAPDSQEVDEQRTAAALVDDARRAGANWVITQATISPEEEAVFARWDRAAELLRKLEQAPVLSLPPSLSTTQLMALRRDPQAFAEQLLRRMPRKPSPAASIGSAFHEWVQHRFDAASGFEEFDQIRPDIRSLVQAFERGRFGKLVPIAVEVPFSMSARGVQLRGRIDAIYPWQGEFDELVVDWKTSSTPADPLQLAVYRRAWAEATDLDPARVGAAFYHVRQDRLVFAPSDDSSVQEALGLDDLGLAVS